MIETHQLFSELKACGEYRPDIRVHMPSEVPALAANALDEAAELIKHFGWTSMEYQHEKAERWLKKYFPERL